MKEIKITNGTYGHNIGGSIIAKTPADGAFEVSEKNAARLVKLGVAKYTDAAVEEQDTGSNVLQEYSDKMNLAQLGEVGKTYGVDTSEAKTRKAAVEMLDVAKGKMEAETAASVGDDDDNGENGGSIESNTDGDGNDEQPPALQPAAPVQ